MYKEFYGLKGDPFRLSPDHAFCYRYPSFAKGRAYMQYALQAAEGFVVVTGSPGMGKTTLINDLLSDYRPTDYLVATLVNTMLEANEVLRSAAYEFGINVQDLDTATVLQRLKQLFSKSHQDGRPPLLVVDEAQNLTLSALEELRMLTNLQYQGKPLLQIFLVGQEGLRDKLQDPSLEQLRQRVTAAAHLEPLNQEQTAAYILHRLKVVGWNNFPKIKASVLPVIESACEGVPRRINQFCSRLLLHGAVEQKASLDVGDAEVVVGELSEERLSSRPSRPDSMLESVTLAEAAEVEDTLVETAGEASQGRKKVVMPPPRRAEAPAPAVPLVPSMEETFAGYPDAYRVGRSAPQDHLYGPFDAPPSDASRVTYPGRHRPPKTPWFGYMLAFLIMLAAGAFAWYQLDHDRATELLDLQFDAYLQSLPPESGLPDSGPGISPFRDGAGVDPDPPPAMTAPERADRAATTAGR